MERIEFEDATLIKDAYVEIDGVQHTVIPAQTAGGTDLNKETFETLQDNIETAINGVVESGSDETSKWVKYADGTMQCYGYAEVSDIELTAWGSLYAVVIDNPFNFPQTFSEAPQCMINTPDISGRYTFNVHSVVTSTTGVTKIGLNRATDVTGTTRLNYIAIGKWK